jgi:AAA domain
MSFRNKIKKNVPKVELHSIMSLIVGTYKTGKTRLWKEVTELHYTSPEEALLIAFEAGYETWELDNIIAIHEEGSDEDLWKVWEYFKKVLVPDLVKEAKENKVIKLIGVDTADRCIDACTAWILRDKTKKYGKPFSSLQEISNNTDENGWTVLYEELKKPFDMLRNASYGIMSLGWTKEKETTLYNGMKYNSIELMMHGTGRKVFESQASLICCLHNEIIVKDKSGNELEDNVKDKKGREKASNFHETKTVMYFRPSEYVSIAGGRYTDLPEKVDYSAENFLAVFEEAVKGQLKKTNKTVEQIKLEEEQAQLEKAKEYAEKLEEEEEQTIPELLEKIKNITDKMSQAEKDQLIIDLKSKFGERNYNYNKYTSIEDVKWVYQKVTGTLTEVV